MHLTNFKNMKRTRSGSRHEPRRHKDFSKSQQMIGGAKEKVKFRNKSPRSHQNGYRTRAINVSDPNHPNQQKKTPLIAKKK